MKTVLLNVKYKNLSPGDFASFEDEEAEYLLTKKMPVKGDRNERSQVPFGTLAKELILLKSMSKDELEVVAPSSRIAVLGDRKEIGDCITLVASDAEKLIKMGAAEEMIALRYRQEVKLSEHTVIQRGHVASIPASQAAKLIKDGVARPVG